MLLIGTISQERVRALHPALMRVTHAMLQAGLFVGQLSDLR